MDDKQESFTKAQELRSFLFLSVVMAPVIAGIVVAGYGNEAILDVDDQRC